jgi:hypothetical protein
MAAAPVALPATWLYASTDAYTQGVNPGSGRGWRAFSPDLQDQLNRVVHNIEVTPVPLRGGRWVIRAATGVVGASGALELYSFNLGKACQVVRSTLFGRVGGPTVDFLGRARRAWGPVPCDGVTKDTVVTWYGPVDNGVDAAQVDYDARPATKLVLLLTRGPSLDGADLCERMRRHAQSIDGAYSRTEFLPICWQTLHTGRSAANVLHMSGALGALNRWMAYFKDHEPELPFLDALAYADPDQRAVLLDTLSGATRRLVADWHAINNAAPAEPYTTPMVLMANGANAVIAHAVLPRLVASDAHPPPLTSLRDCVFTDTALGCMPTALRAPSSAPSVQVLNVLRAVGCRLNSRIAPLQIDAQGWATFPRVPPPHGPEPLDFVRHSPLTAPLAGDVAFMVRCTGRGTEF